MAESTAEISSQLRQGEQVGKYQLVENVGEGAAGEVWLAIKNNNYQTVALKMLHPGVDPGLIQHEAKCLQLAQAAKTKYVLEFYKLAYFEKRPVLVTEFIDNNLAPSVGPSDKATIALRQTMTFDYARVTSLGPNRAKEKQNPVQKRKPVYLDLAAIGHTMFQVADGVIGIYGQDLLHRDIKPSNIGLRGGLKEAVLLDFGAARTIENSDQSSPGTLLYMSPERAICKAGFKLPLASEVYALGVTAYELITQGEHPLFSREWLKSEIIKAKQTIMDKQDIVDEARDSAIAQELAKNILREITVGQNGKNHPFRSIVLDPDTEPDSLDKLQIGQSAIMAINQDLMKLVAFDWRQRLDQDRPEESLRSTMFRLSHSLRQLETLGFGKKDLKVAA